MDFNDTPEEAAFRAEARAFLEQHLELKRAGAPRRGMGENLTPEDVAEAQAWQKTKAENGWACITWPEEYGGRGASPIQKLIWGQEEAEFEHPNTTVFSIGTGMCGPTILAHGTDEQKAKWIPKLVSGEEIWCQLFSEPSAGSDLAGLRMSAVQDGDEWVLNGQKIWTSGANWCEWGVIVTRSDPNAAKHAGLTYFVVNMRDPGIEIRPIRQINGGQGFNEVFFTDVRIPDAWRLDAVGNGWRVAITTLMNERASIGSAGGESLIESLIEYAQTLPLGGGRALDDPAVRQRVADFYVRSKGVEYTGHRTVTTLSKGGIPGPEASLGKLVGGALMQEIASYAMDLQGQAGAILAEDGFQGTYLGIPGLRIAGGTDEVLPSTTSPLPPLPSRERGRS
jgi:acyl-CoA dehydrogenase